MKRRYLLIGVGIVALILGGAAFALRYKKTRPLPTLPSNPKVLPQASNPISQDSSSSTTTSSTSTSATSSNGKSSTAVTLSYTGSAFTPDTINATVPLTLTVRNDSKDALSFNSDPHPQHTQCPNLNLGAIDPGQSKSVTITSPETCGFHNHLNPSQHGTLNAHN